MTLKKNILLLLCLVLPAVVFSGEDDWIKKSIDLTINTKFNEAELLLKHRIEAGDSTLETWFYYASVLNSKMTHFENYEDSGNFLAILNKVIEKSNQKLAPVYREARERGSYLFFRGSAYGYKAFFEGKNEQWLAALDDGLKSVADLQQAVQLDSTLYEAWLGIGVYKYWRSTKLKFLLWTPFVDDLRDEGIEDIKRAIRYSNHSSYMAMHQLIYILLDYKRYEEALYYGEKVVRAYPESPFMWWAYGHIFYKMHKNEKAIKVYEHLLGLLKADPEANPSHLITCHLRLAEIYKRMEDRGNSLEQCRLGLQIKYGDRLSETGKESLKRLKEIMEYYTEKRQSKKN